MSLTRDSVMTVYERFFRFVDKEGFHSFFQLDPSKVKTAFGMTPMIWYTNTIGGLQEFDKAYNKIDLGRLFKLWASQIEKQQWDPEEVPAILSPVLFSLMALSLYVQVNKDKLNDPATVETFKNIEENLVYTYRMSIQKLGKINPQSASVDRTVSNMGAYLKTRSVRYKNYVKGLVAFVKTYANPSQI